MAEETKAPTPPAPTPAEANKAPTPAAPTPAPAAQAAPEGVTKLEQAAVAAHEASATDKPSPAPAVAGAIPEHVPLGPAVTAERLTPDPGAGGTRSPQHTQPIIGGVEGNIAKPVTAALVGLPFDRMGVGDSFHVPAGVTVQQLQAAADKYAGTKQGVKFEALIDSEGFPRVWRDA